MIETSSGVRREAGWLEEWGDHDFPENTQNSLCESSSGRRMEGGKWGGERHKKGAPIHGISLGVIDIIAIGVVTHLTNTSKHQRSTRSMFDSFCLSLI